jgi:hypothetical protein
MTVLAGNEEEQMDNGEEEYEGQEDGDDYGDDRNSEPEQR